MNFTPTQLKAIDELGMSTLIKRAMWVPERELGYCSRGKRSYDINIANDTGSNEGEICILLHELGHVYYGHMDIDNRKELSNIKEFARSNNYNYIATMLFYGGPFSFLNIAMDLEVNTKLLTDDNINTIEDEIKVSLITRKKFDIDGNEDTFRDYYKPLFEYAKNNDAESLSEEVKKAIKDLIEDLMESGSGVSTGDSDIDDLLKKEDYVGGNDKSKRNNKEDSITVDDYESGLYSTVGTAEKKVEISEGSSSEDIKNFILSIIDYDRTKDYKQDSIIHYNRGSRRNNDGLLYTTSRRKVGNKRQSKKLGIVIDISGSMETTSVLSAVRSIKDIFNLIHRDSELITCNTKVAEKFPINNIPEKVMTGGGTDMAAGLKYFIENRFSDIVIYSDFETDMDTMIELANSNPKTRIYSIFVDNGWGDEYEESTEWINRNKKVLHYKNTN